MKILIFGLIELMIMLKKMYQLFLLVPRQILIMRGQSRKRKERKKLNIMILNSLKYQLGIMTRLMNALLNYCIKLFEWNMTNITKYKVEKNNLLSNIIKGIFKLKKELNLLCWKHHQIEFKLWRIDAINVKYDIIIFII